MVRAILNFSERRRARPGLRALGRGRQRPLVAAVLLIWNMFAGVSPDSCSDDKPERDEAYQGRWAGGDDIVEDDEVVCTSDAGTLGKTVRSSPGPLRMTPMITTVLQQPRVLVPGLLTLGPGVERYRITGGGATVLALGRR